MAKLDITVEKNEYELFDISVLYNGESIGPENGGNYRLEQWALDDAYKIAQTYRQTLIKDNTRDDTLTEHRADTSSQPSE